VVPLLPAQDHKRAFDGDKGPNTGGMGAYAPVPWVKAKLLKEIHKRILLPTVKGMKAEKIPYKGVLYAGLMITQDGPKVLEYNVRFGDPETQPLMMLLKTNLLDIFNACIDGKLKQSQVKFKNGASVCVVLAAPGYPGDHPKGMAIAGLDKKYGKNVQIFHAGTSVKNGNIITSGGRVLGVTASGKTFNTAKKSAYTVIGNGVKFTGMQYRHDIGKGVHGA
jgi:phosphoribosylamine---glycine ligase